MGQGGEVLRCQAGLIQAFLCLEVSYGASHELNDFLMLTVWGRRSSFNLQKVMWLVGELEVAHRHIEAGGQFGGLDTPEFRAMNPHGRVPVIDDDGTIVWESHVISALSGRAIWARLVLER